jgi:hypothetical protein
MELYQIKKLHSKGSNQENEEITYKERKHLQTLHPQRIIIQNILETQTTQ